ncbi:hypothetical protein C8R44DRAFT_754662 [Mycena epipterygia]|nr:hypothetical protein C8R44DRAFT_754662 [Mycena epipterygia]
MIHVSPEVLQGPRLPASSEVARHPPFSDHLPCALNDYAGLERHAQSGGENEDLCGSVLCHDPELAPLRRDCGRWKVFTWPHIEEIFGKGVSPNLLVRTACKSQGDVFNRNEQKRGARVICKHRKPFEKSPMGMGSVEEGDMEGSGVGGAVKVHRSSSNTPGDTHEGGGNGSKGEYSETISPHLCTFFEKAADRLNSEVAQA